jgi:hypothetical protein
MAVWVDDGIPQWTPLEAALTQTVMLHETLAD